MTNYRRSGETFCNLVSLLPVHDSYGVYRFVVSVQCEVNNDRLSREQLELQLRRHDFALPHELLDLAACVCSLRRRRHELA